MSKAQGACSYTSPAPVFRRLIVCVSRPFPLFFLCFFFAGSAPSAARAVPPSPSVAAPVCPVSECSFAAAVAACPVCSSSSRCRFAVAGAAAAFVVLLPAAAPSPLLLAPSLRCAVAAGIGVRATAVGAASLLAVGARAALVLFASPSSPSSSHRTRFLPSAPSHPPPAPLPLRSRNLTVACALLVVTMPPGCAVRGPAPRGPGSFLNLSCVAANLAIRSSAAASDTRV